MDLSEAVWRKSARSGDDGGECVEVAVNLPDVTAVRDSKNPDGPVLRCGHGEWGVFVSAVKDGDFRY
ncbi:DUF397 domain-containing protein [Sphaerisporangium sp. B11E5]|uniref:DUF397 domain-containing protein n=1 Tax=Sphaerisporangium sp. B11E5 TaxID=3153563 RepID=UPI00325C474F